MKPYFQWTWKHEKSHCSSSPNFSLTPISTCFYLHLPSSLAFKTFRRREAPLLTFCKTELQTSHHHISSWDPSSFYSLFPFDHHVLCKCLIICFPKFGPVLPPLFPQFLAKPHFIQEDVSPSPSRPLFSSAPLNFCHSPGLRPHLFVIYELGFPQRSPFASPVESETAEGNSSLLS